MKIFPPCPSGIPSSGASGVDPFAGPAKIGDQEPRSRATELVSTTRERQGGKIFITISPQLPRDQDPVIASTFYADGWTYFLRCRR